MRASGLWVLTWIFPALASAAWYQPMLLPRPTLVWPETSRQTPVITSINDQGEVVGRQYIYTSTSEYRAVYWDVQGKVKDLTRPSSGSAHAINDLGAILMLEQRSLVVRAKSGTRSISGVEGMELLMAGDLNAAGQAVATDWKGGLSYYVPKVGSAIKFKTGTSLYAINGKGVVAGDNSFDGPFTWSEAKGFSYLPPSPQFPGLVMSPTDINDAGRVVATAYDPATKVRRPFLFDGVDTHPLPLLDGFDSARVLSLNNAEVAVGYAFDSTDNTRPWHAVLWLNRQVYDLNDLIPAGSGWELGSAVAISDGGFIAGVGRRNGVVEPFRLQAIPEPASLSLCFMAMGLLLRRSSRPGAHGADQSGFLGD